MANNQLRRKNTSIVYLSTFPPRECGIATFTQDLLEAVQRKYNPALKPKVLAINEEVTDIYPYDRRVVREIVASNIDDYVTLARELNAAEEVKLVHIQHEFGLFGGDEGNHLIPFFQVIEKPVVVTLHTVLPRPKPHMLRVTRIIAEHAKAMIVMNELSKQILLADYGVNPLHVQVIPHGIPYIATANGKREKERLGLQDHLLLMTFGLLSKGKGIEHALRALPPVVRRHPETLYLVLGVTHPVVRRHEGEEYRNFLEKEVRRLGLRDNVRFYNRYLPLDELTSYLRAADIYLSSSLDRNQSVSGTLSYALGCGTPVICTESLYAKSVVDAESGFLVRPKHPEEITKSLLALCRDEKKREEMGKAAYLKTRHMSWPNVALAHFSLYQRYAPLVDEQKLPELKLQHLDRLTDDFGVIQFAKHTKPDLHYGYALDDNARGAIVASLAAFTMPEEALPLLETYLRFMRFVQRKNGSFVNLVTGQRKRLPKETSEDAQGRALWALGCVMSKEYLPDSVRKQAQTMFRRAVLANTKLSSSRAISFAILGLYFALQAGKNQQYERLLKRYADILLKRFSETSSADWMWFENELTYSNSKLSEALFLAYLETKKKKYLEIAEKSLQFLLRITFEKGQFFPIGQNGWYLRQGKRAYFDQQPEETSSMVQTLLVATEATKSPEYRDRAMEAFQWFLGKNHLQQMVYDEATGGCYDGLGEESLNLNQGAESTLSYLLARLELGNYQKS